MNFQLEEITQCKQDLAQYIVAISQQIPEFGVPYSEDVYLNRLLSKKHLILVAKHQAKPIGFKIGYELNAKTFYSWMGGVLPNFRKQGIAKSLAQRQETWAVANGYSHIRMKTRNYLKPMLHFALANHFYITGVESQWIIAFC